MARSILTPFTFSAGGNAINNDAAATVPLTIKGAASQSANLLELQNSSGTILSRFTSTGLYSTSTSPAVAGIQHTSGSGAYFAFNHNVGSATLFTNAAANKGLVVRGEVSQSANLLELQNSSGTILSKITASGDGSFGAIALGNGTIYGSSSFLNIASTSAGQIGAIIKASSTQSTDHLQFQSSASVVLGGSNAVGQAFTGSTSTITSAVGGTIQSIASGANPLVTMASAHGLAVGDLVTLAATTGSTYNGTFVIATVPLTTTFTITSALTAGQAGAAGTVSVPAQASITARSAGTIGAVVRGASSQSANIFEIQSSAGTVLARFASTGQLLAPSIVGTAFQITSGGVFSNGSTSAPASTQAYFLTTSATNVGLVVRGAASQSANLFELQNSSGTILARFDSGGNLKATNVATLNSTGQMTESNSGALFVMGRATAQASSPGLNFGTLYFRDGTTSGTLKLATRTGASGIEETIVDNLSSTGSTAGAQFVGAGGVNTAGALVTTSSVTTGAALNLNYASPTIASNNASTASIFTTTVTGVTIGSSTIRTTAFPADSTVSTAAAGLGYMGIPQNSTTTGAYTIAAGDAGEHIYSTATRTVTIPANGTVAFPVGTTISFVSGSGATTTIAITTDTLQLVGGATANTAGTSRTLAAFGMATAVKVASTTWYISGNGLT